METTITPPSFVLDLPIKFTSGAIKQIKKLLDQETAESKRMLRVGVKGGGCSGMSYILEFDDATNNDQIFQIDGISVAMNKAHGMYLYGTEIDFPEGLDARGFVFNNPNAEKTCGCGQSFSA